MIRTFSIFFFLLLLFCSTKLQADNHFQKLYKFTTEHGIANNTILSVFQDSIGLIWIGTLEGLCSYNGTEFTNYQKSDSSTGNAIHFIDQLNVNQLLLGTNKGNFIFSISEKSFLKINLPQKVYSPIAALFRINNKVYIGSESGVFEYDEIKQTGINISDIAVTCKQLSPKGKLLLGTKANGIWEANIKSDTLSFINIFPQLNNENLLSIDYEENNIPVFLTDKGLWISGREEIRAETSVFFTSMSISQNNKILVGTNNEFIQQLHFTDGLYSLKEYIDKGNEIFNDYYDSQVTVLFRDNSGSIWMGTNKAGLNRIDHKKITYKKYNNYDQEVGVEAGYINGLTQGNDGKIWIGTSGKGLYLINQIKKELEAVPILKGNMNDLFIEAIFQFKDKLYIGTRHMGIITANYPSANSSKVVVSGQLFSSQAGLNKSDYIYALKQFNEKLYICTNRGSFVSGGNVNDLERVDDMPSIDIEVDSLNNMWVLSLDMELYYNRNKYELGSEVSDFHIENNKDIWITTSKGLALIQNDGSNPIFYNPPNKVIEFTSIEKDKEGQFWLGSRMGIYRFDSKNKLFASYIISGGSKANSFNHGKILKSYSGEFYWGSNDGVVSIIPDSSSFEFEPFYNVEQGTNGAESVFHVYNYSYNHHEDNCIAYKFAHPDSTWHYVYGNKTTLDFSHFRKGSYQIDITAINSNGIINKKYTSFEFKVKPKYNISLILLFVFAFISSVIVIVNRRSKRTVESFVEEEEESKMIETLEDVIYNGWMRNDFMQKAILLIEHNISDSSYGVNELYAEIKMSKSNFYRKLKTNTNLSPNELIRFVRLKKSIPLLIEAKLSVNEIAYDMGFNSPSYFTRCFKQQFGMAPSEYKSVHGQS